MSNYPSYVGAIAVSPIVGAYVQFVEGLATPRTPLPLRRSSPLALFLQSHLVVPKIYESAPRIPNLEELLPGRLYYEVDGQFAHEGFVHIPDEAAWAFHRMGMALIAQQLSVMGRVGRRLKIELKNITEAFYLEASLEGVYEYDAVVKREQRLRGDQQAMFVHRRTRAARLCNSHPPPKAKAEPMPLLFQD